MKFLYQPVKPWIVGQKFGEDRVCTNGTKYVLKKGDTCPVGYESLYQKFGLNGHSGVDVATYRGQPVYCACDGEVVYISTEESRGLGVEVLSKVGGKYYRHAYWHFQGNNVHVGQNVVVGDILGWADSTGASTGDHLHFSVKETDSRGNAKNRDNGYYGAIDPLPFMYDIYALDAAPLLKQIKEIMADIIEILANKIRGYSQ